MSNFWLLHAVKKRAALSNIVRRKIDLCRLIQGRRAAHDSCETPRNTEEKESDAATGVTVRRTTLLGRLLGPAPEAGTHVPCPFPTLIRVEPHWSAEVLSHSVS